MKRFKLTILVTALCVCSIGVSALQNTAWGQEIPKEKWRDRPSKSDDTRMAVKVNGLLAVLIVNPAIEFKVWKQVTVQLEAFGSFYSTNFLGTNKPFVLGSGFLEGRYYIKKAFDGFYFGPNIGFGVYKLNKSLVFRYGDQYNDYSYQQGSNVMIGLTVGYQYNINKHWSLEFSWSGGFQQTVYDGYRPLDPNKPHSESNPYTCYTYRDASAEWPVLYKGGILVGYRF